MKVYSFVSQDMHVWEGKSCFVVFVAGSNLNLGFDHISTVSEPKHTWKEVEVEMKKVWANNVVVFKGGESLLYPDFVVVAKKLKLKNQLVYIETNGMFPDRLKNCIDRKVVDFVCVQIKELDINQKVQQTIELLNQSGVAHEVCVVWNPNLSKEDIKQIAEKTQAKSFVIQGFKPGECADQKYNSKPETTKEELIELAGEIQGQEHVFVRFHSKKTRVR